MRPRLVILILLSLGLSAPPLPKAPHKSAAVHQGAGAQKLIANAPRAVVLRSVRLDWDFAGSPEGVVFNVWQGPKWKLAATVSGNACVLPLDRSISVAWFKVTSSNTITGLESVWASR